MSSKRRWLHLILGIILGCRLSGVAYASGSHGVIFDCEMFEYHLYWEGKVVDDWSKRETSPDISRFRKFSFKVLADHVQFERGSFLEGHKYEYGEFRVSDRYHDIVGMDYTKDSEVDAFSFWHGQHQPKGLLMFSRTNTRSVLYFNASCTRKIFD